MCLSLLSRRPTPKDTLPKVPSRSLEFFFGSRAKYVGSLKALRKLNQESDNYDRKIWLLKNADDIRQMYNLPNP